MKLVVTIPAYNEEKTIARVIGEIPRQVEGIDSVEIVVIDDGSTEGTAARAREAGADHIVSHRINRGLGTTFRDGLEAALEQGADVVVNIDGDGQYDASEIPSLLEPLLDDRADVVLGWRDIDHLDFMPRGKKIGNRIATFVTRLAAGVPIRDAQSGFRAFTKEAILNMNLSGRYTYVQESIIEASYRGLRIEQVPVDFRPRDGQSRLIPNLASYANRAGRIILRKCSCHLQSAMLFYLAAALLFVGIVLGIFVMVHFFSEGTVAAHGTLIVISVALLATGVQTLVLSLVSMHLDEGRRLQEQILYRLKKREYETHSRSGSSHADPCRRE